MMQSNLRVLIIDANPNDVQIARGVIESSGFTLEVRTDGTSAIEAFHAIQPDLVLVDARVPETDGIHVCKELRQTELGRSTPIVLMMEEADPRAHQTALKASGCALVLQKPLTPQDLLESMSQLLPGAFLPGKPVFSHDWEGREGSSLQEDFLSQADGLGPAGDLSFDESDVGMFLDEIFPSKETSRPPDASRQAPQTRPRPRASLRAGLEDEAKDDEATERDARTDGDGGSAKSPEVGAEPPALPAPDETIELTSSMIQAVDETASTAPAPAASPAPAPAPASAATPPESSGAHPENISQSARRRAKRKAKLSRKERSRISASLPSQSDPAPPRADEPIPIAPPQMSALEAQPIASDIQADPSVTETGDLQVFHATSTVERPEPVRRRGGWVLAGLVLAVAAGLVIFFYMVHRSGEGDLGPTGSPSADGDRAPAPESMRSQVITEPEDPLLTSQAHPDSDDLGPLSPPAHASQPSAAASLWPQIPDVGSPSYFQGPHEAGSLDPDSTAHSSPQVQAGKPATTEGIPRSDASSEARPHTPAAADRSPLPRAKVSEEPPAPRSDRSQRDRTRTPSSSRGSTTSQTPTVEIQASEDSVALEADKTGSEFSSESEPITSPVPLRRQTPKYPSAALSLKQSGSVGLLVKVAPNGTVSEVRVTHSVTPALDQAAVGAAYKWTYKPAHKGSRPVTTWVEETVNFQIE